MLQLRGVGIEGPKLPSFEQQISGILLRLASSHRSQATLFAVLPQHLTSIHPRLPREDVELSVVPIPQAGVLRIILVGDLIKQMIDALREDAAAGFPNFGEIIRPMQQYLASLVVES